MASLITSFLVFGHFFFFANGFQVSFYKNTNCAGEFVGGWIGGEAQGCRHDYVGLAEGAVVQSTGSVDDDTTVQFYSSSDCAPGTEISRGNGRCIALDHEAIGTYQSFKVTPLNALATRSTRSTPKQRRHPSRSPSPDGAFAPTPNIQHGMDISFDGEQYRLLQIYGNGYIGIPQHEWDDTIHIANNDELLPAFGRNTTVRALDERDLVRDLCGLATSCVTAVQNGVPQIRDAISPFIENLKTAARARGVQAVEFLQQPFFTQVALETIGGIVPSAVGGVIQAVVGAKIAGDSNNAQACSSQQDQIDALFSIVKSQISALDAASATISVLQRDAGDEVFTVTVTVVACGTAIEGGGCGVAGGFCTA